MPHADRDQALRALRSVLREVEFTPARLAELLGVRSPDDVGLLNHAPVLERVKEHRSPAAQLIRLFCLEDSMPRVDLREVLPRALQRSLVEAGVLSLEGQKLAARLRVDAVGEHCFVADRRFREPDRHALGLPRGDVVYPAGADSVLLSEATAELHARCVLDLCAGSGVQSLSVAPRAGEVIGVDITARAVAVARANAVFNGVDNCEFCRGDLFAPVHGRRFDLLLANPPFVPGPTRGPRYHSGGPRGDRVVKRILQGLQSHLSPAGRAFVVAYLALGPKETVDSVVRSWLPHFAGRVLALVLDSGSVIDLAAAQSVFALDGGLAAYASEVRRWTRYLRRQGLSRVVLVLLVAERVDGRRGVDVRSARQETLSLPIFKPPRQHIAEWLAES